MILKGNRTCAAEDAENLAWFPALLRVDSFPSPDLPIHVSCPISCTRAEIALHRPGEPALPSPSFPTSVQDWEEVMSQSNQPSVWIKVISSWSLQEMSCSFWTWDVPAAIALGNHVEQMGRGAAAPSLSAVMSRWIHFFISWPRETVPTLHMHK